MITEQAEQQKEAATAYTSSMNQGQPQHLEQRDSIIPAIYNQHKGHECKNESDSLIPSLAEQVEQQEEPAAACTSSRDSSSQERDDSLGREGRKMTAQYLA